MAVAAGVVVGLAVAFLALYRGLHICEQRDAASRQPPCRSSGSPVAPFVGGILAGGLASLRLVFDPYLGLALKLVVVAGLMVICVAFLEALRWYLHRHPS